MRASGHSLRPFQPFAERPSPFPPLFSLSLANSLSPSQTTSTLSPLSLSLPLLAQPFSYKYGCIHNSYQCKSLFHLPWLCISRVESTSVVILGTRHHVTSHPTSTFRLTKTPYLLFDRQSSPVFVYPAENGIRASLRSQCPRGERRFLNCIDPFLSTLSSLPSPIRL